MFKGLVKSYLMEQETEFVFHIPALEGAETTKGGERKFWPLHFQSDFPLNLPLTEEEHARTAALCFLCGQPAATGTPCHAGASTLVYI